MSSTALTEDMTANKHIEGTQIKAVNYCKRGSLDGIAKYLLIFQHTQRFDLFSLLQV